MSYLTAVEVGRLYEPLSRLADARRDIAGEYLNLPGLRGYWPMGTVNGQGEAVDLSGLGNTMATDGTPVFGVYRGLPYATLSGAENFRRSSFSDIEITGTETHIEAGLRGLTIGCWLRPASPMVSGVGIVAKWHGVAGGRSYLLYLASNIPPIIRSHVSSDGSSFVKIDSSVTISATQWYFVVTRFVPNSTLDVYVNGTKDTETSSVPASVHDSTTEFLFGRYTNAPRFEGDLSHVFITATALPDTTIDNLYQTTKTLLQI